MGSPYWKGPLPGVDVQRRLPVENIPGASRTAFRGRPKSVRLRPGIRVRLQPGMVFGISPESCSASPRNAVRLVPEYAGVFGARDGVICGSRRRSYTDAFREARRFRQAGRPTFCPREASAAPAAYLKRCSGKYKAVGRKTRFRAAVISAPYFNAYAPGGWV